MKKFVWVIILAIVFACKEDDDPKVYDSIIGSWETITPDSETRVIFTISQDATTEEYSISSATVNHLGGDNADPIDAEIVVTSTTEIESITMVTNDFVVRLLDIRANENFTQLTITNSVFIIGGEIRNFSGLVVGRR